ncbi:unnamed protein product [Rhizoctonia solani]|uniref:Uncharacterized protein n=1 Tax=Rhizoctonia solani TaxID=456999 RepID=A0A8H3CG17_9AGAM|nr:unnamed protein product [Rhizoctonia solani]
MKFLTIFSTVLLASVAHGASSHARRAAADSVIYPELTVRTPTGVELTARDTSPAHLNELLGRACCTVCIPKNSDNCGCCGMCC